MCSSRLIQIRTVYIRHLLPSCHNHPTWKNLLPTDTNVQIILSDLDCSSEIAAVLPTCDRKWNPTSLHQFHQPSTNGKCGLLNLVFFPSEQITVQHHHGCWHHMAQYLSGSVEETATRRERKTGIAWATASGQVCPRFRFGSLVVWLAFVHVGRSLNYSLPLNLLTFSFLMFCFVLLFFLYRAYSIVDSSRVSTFLISILLIVYGSFR